MKVVPGGIEPRIVLNSKAGIEPSYGKTFIHLDNRYEILTYRDYTSRGVALRLSEPYPHTNTVLQYTDDVPIEDYTTTSSVLSDITINRLNDVDRERYKYIFEFPLFAVTFIDETNPIYQLIEILMNDWDLDDSNIGIACESYGYSFRDLYPESYIYAICLSPIDRKQFEERYQV